MLELSQDLLIEQDENSFSDDTKLNLSKKNRTLLDRLTRVFIANSTGKIVDVEYLPDPRAEWESQMRALLERGYHDMFSQSEKEYRDSFPKPSSRPRKYENRFNIPLLVEPRISA